MSGATRKTVRKKKPAKAEAMSPARRSATPKKQPKKQKEVKPLEAYQLPAWRYRTAVAGIATLGLLLIGRIAALQVLPDMDQGYEFLQHQGDQRTIRVQAVPAYRGSILDRNGKPLAVSTPLIDVTADPRHMQPVEFKALAAALDMPLSELQKKVDRYSTKRFMYIKRGLRPEDAELLTEKRFSGVQIVEDFQRFYPDSEVLAQTLGLTHSEGYGIEGLELSYNDWLSGTPGKKRVVIDANQTVVDYLGLVTPAESGNDLVLTIDLELQYLTYKALKTAYVKHRAASASMIVMNPRTGEILALASQPSFNPNNRGNIEYDAVRNRAFLDTFEPGSTVKPFTLLAALESGQYLPDTKIDTDPGYVRVDGNLIKDYRNYKELDLTSVLSKSSQVGTVKVALSLDHEQVFNTFRQVGLGDPAVMGFPGEVGGDLPQRTRWNEIQRATFSYGYGITATTLQLAQAYSIIANSGLRVSPKLIQGGSVPPPEQVVSAEATDQIKEMMRTVVEEGTGTRAAIENYSVAGKTGTGHLVGAGGYEDHRYTSMFAGMAPADNPELVAVIVITDPKGEDYFGGLVAAPVFSTVVGNALRVLNVPGETQELLLGANP